MTYLTSTAHILAFVVAATVGCGSDSDSSTVEGRISDGDGYSATALTLGGQGAAEAATAVEAYAVADDGSLVLVGEASVEANARYSITVPADTKALILQARDAGGAVVGSVIVESSGTAGAVITASPMTSETSLEARVFVEMIAGGVNVANANTIDLRTRLSARLAAALRDAEQSGADIRAEIIALAEAVAAAQATEIEAYAAAGVEITQAELFEAELAAVEQLSANLHAGTDSDAEIYADFLAALDAVAAARGIGTEGRARSEACASMGFRATLEAELGASANSDAILDAAISQAGFLEARASGIALGALGDIAAGVDDAADLAVAAAAELRAQISASATAEAVASAFASFSAELVGEGDINATVLGSYLGADVATEANAQATVDAAVSAAATLDATLSAGLDAVFEAGGSVDASAVASTIVSAYGEFFAAIDTDVSALLDVFPTANAQVTASILIAAEGAFRLGQ